MALRLNAEHGLLIFEVSISHNDASQSVGLLWTSDQPVTNTSTWQHTTLNTDIHAPGGIRTNNPSKQAAVDPRLRPRNLTFSLFKKRHKWVIRDNADYGLNEDIRFPGQDKDYFQ